MSNKINVSQWWLLGGIAAALGDEPVIFGLMTELNLLHLRQILGGWGVFLQNQKVTYSTLCIWKIPKHLLLQIVKTQMKCCIMWLLIRV